MFVLLLMMACKKGPEVVDREPGARAPLTAECNDLDPTDCVLPWPSSAFLRADATTATGLRVAVEPSALPVDDDVDYLNLADGFSRVTGVVAGFDGAVDSGAVSWDPAASLASDAPLQVFCAEPGAACYGERLPFRTELRSIDDLEGEHHVLIGRPAGVLAANAEHVAIVLDTLGNDEAAPRSVQLALGLIEPETDAEAALVGYHAPTRALLAEQGVDPERVLRVWDFTTRSAGDATFRLHAMMDTLEASLGDLTVEVDEAYTTGDTGIAVIVRGRLVGAPAFVDDTGHLVLDDGGVPQVVGTRDIEFRLMVPAGDGDYRVALYGHGTGGDVTDPAFDSELGANGIAKLSLKFDGWTGDEFVRTLLGFRAFLDGSAVSTAGLMEALAGGSVLLTSLDGALGDVVAADRIGELDNPAAGRRPQTDAVAWVGGSQGGTMGAVMVSADPRLRFGVLNVPGAGWTHMVPYSLLYEAGMGGVLEDYYGDILDVHTAIVMGQGSWDEVDGGPWAEEALAAGGVFLLQESMDDPILPNLGTELLAAAFDATVIEPDLVPVYGLETTTGAVTAGASLTQYRVPDTGQYDVHGFAARDTPAGEAAREQILEFLTTAWDGAPQMTLPDGCAEVTANGDCDFSGMW